MPNLHQNQYAEELRAIKAKKDTTSKFGTIFVKGMI
jgi:hypothetical protein